MIKQPFFMVISMVLLVGLGIYAMERINFLRTAERVIGVAAEVSARNDICGTRRNRNGTSRRYSCTKFYTDVEYVAKVGGTHHLRLSTGEKRNHNQPVSYSRIKRGEAVPVVYSSANPEKAYEDTLFGVWGGPIVMFMFQISTFFASLTEKRRRFR